MCDSGLEGPDNLVFLKLRNHMLWHSFHLSSETILDLLSGLSFKELLETLSYAPGWSLGKHSFSLVGAGVKIVVGEHGKSPCGSR
jgi:hypothetical protein